MSNEWTGSVKELQARIHELESALSAASRRIDDLELRRHILRIRLTEMEQSRGSLIDDVTEFLGEQAR